MLLIGDGEITWNCLICLLLVVLCFAVYCLLKYCWNVLDFWYTFLEFGVYISCLNLHEIICMIFWFAITYVVVWVLCVGKFLLFCGLHIWYRRFAYHFLVCLLVLTTIFSNSALSYIWCDLPKFSLCHLNCFLFSIFLKLRCIWILICFDIFVLI